MQEGNENWHEVGDGLCRQNDIIGFGIARAQRTKLLVKRAQQGALQALQAKSEALQSSLCAFRAQFRALCAHDPKTDDVIFSETPISYFMPIFIALLHF